MLRATQGAASAAAMPGAAAAPAVANSGGLLAAVKRKRVEAETKTERQWRHSQLACALHLLQLDHKVLPMDGGREQEPPPPPPPPLPRGPTQHSTVQGAILTHAVVAGQ